MDNHFEFVISSALWNVRLLRVAAGSERKKRRIIAGTAIALGMPACRLRGEEPPLFPFSLGYAIFTFSQA